MKCVCGYEKRGYDFDESDNEYKDRDPENKRFRTLEGRMLLNGENSFAEDESVLLYVCPECGTVKVG